MPRTGRKHDQHLTKTGGLYFEKYVCIYRNQGISVLCRPDKWGWSMSCCFSIASGSLTSTHLVLLRARWYDYFGFDFKKKKLNFNWPQRSVQHVSSNRWHVLSTSYVFSDWFARFDNITLPSVLYLSGRLLFLDVKIRKWPPASPAISYLLLIVRRWVWYAIMSYLLIQWGSISCARRKLDRHNVDERSGVASVQGDGPLTRRKVTFSSMFTRPLTLRYALASYRYHVIIGNIYTSADFATCSRELLYL